MPGLCLTTEPLLCSLLQGLLNACVRSHDPLLTANLTLTACQTKCPLLLTSALVGLAAWGVWGSAHQGSSAAAPCLCVCISILVIVT